MDAKFSTILKHKRMLVNILSIFVILALVFPVTGNAAAQETSPRITASITHDWFRAEQFSPYGNLTIQIYDQLGGTLLWSENRSADESGFMFFGEWEHPVDLKPGNYIVIADTITTKDLELEAVTLDIFDPSADYLEGTAPPALEGRLVWVGTGNDNYGCGMDVTADPVTGAWSADFSTQPCDVTEDMWAAAQVFDADGDASEGNLPRNPIFTVFPEWDAIEGWNWTQDAIVHLKIDDPDTDQDPDHSQDAQVLPTPWNPNEVWVRIDFAGLYDVKPGDVVTLSEGDTSRTHIVENLVITAVNEAEDTVSGTANDGATIYVWPHATGEQVEATAGPGGTWDADFTGVFDLAPGECGRSEIRDGMGNSTAVDWCVPNPHFSAFPEWEYVEGWEWSLDAMIHMTIDDPATGMNPDYEENQQVVVTPWDPNGRWVQFDFNSQYDLKVGDVVTLTDGVTPRTHTVRNLAISGVDEDMDIVSGTADEGETIFVWPHATGQQLEVTAGPGGIWDADFTEIFDLAQGEGGRSEVRDEFGNATAVDWYIPKPRFVVFPEWEWFDGNDWPDGALVTITVDGKPECGTSAESWGFFFNGSFGEECDIVFGDTVTFTDGVTTRTHTVRRLAVTEVNAEQDTVQGIAAEGETVYVWPHLTGQQLEITVDGTETWQVDFTGLFDLEEGTDGRSEIRDEAGNSTAVDWNAPWSPSTFVVNTTDDSDDGVCDENHCSLREAINTANARAVADSILFNIPGDPSYSIQPQSALPDLTDQVTIDGTSQPGYSGSPIVELDGTFAGDWANGLVLATDNSLVKGLVINRFSGNGILLFGSGNTVHGNYIGTDVTGTTSTGTPGPAVGEYTLTVMSETCPTYPAGTDIDGFVSDSDDPAAPWLGESIHFLGTEVGCGSPEQNGTASLIYRYKLEFAEVTPLASIMVSGAAFNGPDNVLRVLDENMDVLGLAYTYGGNSFQTPFVRLQDVEGQVFYIDEFDTSENWRFRQSIEINVPLPLGNYNSGVAIVGGATNNLIVENLISGNILNGVAVFNPGTTGNIVQENYIGTDVTGTQSLGNAAPGVGIGDQASDNFIIGNLISGNRSDGVALFNPGTNGNTIQGNNIGTDVTGIAALPNAGVGVWIGEGASNTLIGGTDASVRNVISGNQWGGISINHLETTGTQVLGNYIGTNKNGDDILPNGGEGIYISGNQNFIGGPEAGAGNVISGNTANGVSLTEGASQNLIQGNYMGTDVKGTTTTGPAGPVVGSPTLTVMPETCPAYDAGTDRDGFISESDDPFAPWSGISVTFMGTDEDKCGSPETLGEGGPSLIYRYKLVFETPTQLTSIAIAGAAFNGGVLRLLDADGNVLGTTNTVGGNSFQTNYLLLDGVEGTIFFVDEFDYSSDWRFRQSIVINGPNPLGNLGSGVMINSGASENQIVGNLISGNRSDAVALYHAGTNGNILQGNYIGTDATGTAALPNTSAAIWIGEGASNTVIGGAGEGEGNLISGNTGDAISINNSDTTGTVIQGNLIGTDVTGTAAIPNLANGIVLVTGTHNNLIGGMEPGAGNVISGNMWDGVVLVDAGTSGNRVQGNFIGTDLTGMFALGNQFRGVFLGAGASDNLIGGNVISANGAAGVRLIDSGTTANRIQGNFIGTDITGLNPLGNGYIGIRLTDGASNNLIGGTESGDSNVIAFNAAPGVGMSGEGVSGNAILSNLIFENAGLGIDLGEDAVTPNDVLDADAGPNGLQNYPVLTNVTRLAESIKVHGLLVSSPYTTYRLEFFASDACDTSGLGEGQIYLGSASVTANRVGIGNFKITLSASVPQGMFITATATDPDGNTSEFSHCYGPVR